MGIVTEDMRYRQRVLEYAKEHGAREAARRHRTCRQYIYYWRRRWDGTAESLGEKSRKPHHHPKEHTAEEIELIKAARAEEPRDGLVDFWVKLGRRGYTRSCPGLYRLLKRLNLLRKEPKAKKYVPRPYEQMTYPGERVQIDVKVVPKSCIKGREAAGDSWFQYTAIDEYSRYRCVMGYDAQNTYNSTLFLEYILKKFPFPVECVQTDNGSEFTNRFTSNKGKPSRFELALAGRGIRHKLIRPYTPRHNGKVERSHRKDQERFYARTSFSSLRDFQNQLYRYNYKEYNHFPMRPLGWKSPRETLGAFFASRCNK
jgi:transposase InsO family protein